jgi:cellulose synthase/poly-beta-1,6-N-acetylglucosamine synthase-like glycosyltransferase
MLAKILIGFSFFIFIYYFTITLTYIYLIIISMGRLRQFIKQSHTDFYVDQSYAPTPVSVMIPCMNEEKTIVETVKSLLLINFASYEIIVVNDGSTDTSLKKLIDTFQLKRADIAYNDWIPTNKVRGIYASIKIPNLIVLDKYNGGKADALNAGLNVSRYPLICAIDADSVLEKNALQKMIIPFLKDEKMVAVGGMVRIANGCQIVGGILKNVELPNSSILIHQIIEYLRTFLTNRIGFERINSLLIISGAFGLFKRSTVLDLGGYRNTIGEDMDLTIRIHKYFRKNHLKYKVDFVADAECWTQAPSDYKSLKSQRIRWQIGLIDTMWNHKDMLLNPIYGNIGMFSLPYFWFFEMMGPIVEFVGYFIFAFMILSGVVSVMFIWVFVMAYLFGVFFSLAAILLEELSYMHYRKLSEVGLLVFYAFADQLWYRPWLAYCRLLAFFKFRSNRQTWGRIHRKTFIQEHADKNGKRAAKSTSSGIAIES